MDILEREDATTSRHATRQHYKGVEIARVRVAKLRSNDSNVAHDPSPSGMVCRNVWGKMRGTFTLTDF